MKWLPDTDEFFIGYVPKAPRQMSSFLRKVMIILGFVVALVGFLLARSKQSFSSNTFEYGVPTTLEGTLQLSPVPHLRVNMGNDAKQNSIYQTILLVGFGKAGAIETLKKVEREMNFASSRKIGEDDRIISVWRWQGAVTDIR